MGRWLLSLRRKIKSCPSTPSTRQSLNVYWQGKKSEVFEAHIGLPPVVRLETCRGPKLENVTPAQALKHPTWSMGKVITTNSATMVNKGLEVIEGPHFYLVSGSKNIAVTVSSSIDCSLYGRVFMTVRLLQQASVPGYEACDWLLLSVGQIGLPHSTKPLDFTQSHRWDF